MKVGNVRGEQTQEGIKGGGRGDLGCDFPRGLESLNGKSNGAIRCNHKSQKGGKGLRTEMHTEFKVTLT